MPGRLYLFQWDPVSAEKRAAELRQAGWTVEVESQDGARGGRAILNHPPDLILFDLAKRPSHSRETAAGIRGYKAGRRLTMLFIDGEAIDVDKTRAKVSDALFTTSDLLLHHLSKLDF
ncbi:MAG: hypothetical protein HY858_08940 [Candidatus Solibacter usitatus]|nr:hypothetical protein [Candidatus Solibacter usitatus]